MLSYEIMQEEIRMAEEVAAISRSLSPHVVHHEAYKSLIKMIADAKKAAEQRRKELLN